MTSHPEIEDHRHERVVPRGRGYSDRGICLETYHAQGVTVYPGLSRMHDTLSIVVLLKTPLLEHVVDVLVLYIVYVFE